VREITDEAYVVHRRRLRESSYVVQALTRCHGLLSMVLRGAASSKSRRETPVEFRQLQLAWSGKTEMPTIRRAEPLGPMYSFTGERLFCGLYLNELVVRFLHRGDANEQSYQAYQGALMGLNETAPIEPVLRHFEIELLQVCGYAMALNDTADHAMPIAPEGRYFYVPELGAVSARPEIAHLEVRGATLLALAGRMTWTDETSLDAKRLMRFVVHSHLGGRELQSRSLFKYSALAGEAE